MLKIAGFLALLMLATAALAPAWLLERSATDLSGGLVMLTATSGTVWNGEGDLVLRGQPTGGRDTDAGRIGWRVHALDWRHPAVRFLVWQTPAASGPAVVTIGPGRVEFGGRAHLPAAALAAAPWTVGWRFDGDIAVESQQLQWQAGSATGAATALWQSARLVPPDLRDGLALGDITIRSRVAGPAFEIALTNSGGDVELAGSMSTATRTLKLSLRPRASASAEQLAWLQSHTSGRAGGAYTIDLTLPAR